MKLLVTITLLSVWLVEIQGYWDGYLRICHKCKKRSSHEECLLRDGIEICKAPYTACGTYIETNKYGKIKITKGCVKAYDAGCVIQNNCRGGNRNKPYCWYCCYKDFCNVGEWPPSSPDPCRGRPCQNGGTCVARNSDNTFTCRCRPGFTGKFCQDRVNRPEPCRSNPCRNGGSCRSCNGRWDCDCPPRFTGTRCETSINPCRPNPCKNNGRCTASGNGFKCTCRNNFSGRLCQTERNPCRANPCRNGGTCNNHNTGYTCSCRPGYTGATCETGTPCFRCPELAGLFPDQYNCRKFYHCAHWVPFHKDCPAELHFNARLKVCDWPENAGCTPLPSDGNGRSQRDCEAGECLVDQSSPETRSLDARAARNEVESPPTNDDPFYNPMKDLGFTDQETAPDARDVEEEESPSTDDDPFYNPMKDLGFTDQVEPEVVEEREENIAEILRELDETIDDVKRTLE